MTEKKGKSLESNFKGSAKEEDKTFASSEENIKAEALYTVSFRENRSFELFVRGERILFHGRKLNPVYPEKYKNGLPEELINSTDFKASAKYFNIVKK
jgi:hypothetical protein